MQHKQEYQEEQYMRERWQPQRDYYSRKAQLYKQRHLGLLFVSSVGAAFVPVLLIFPGMPVIIPAIISFVVSLALILDNTFHFGDDWRLFRQTLEALKLEKILYEHKVEPYTNAPKSFPLFVRSCEEIICFCRCATCCSQARQGKRAWDRLTEESTGGWRG
ncbi:DUF4231 domain-containing protein [Dictyobacter vulcani]|uniref:DUF4231 domain-containing protein n=1 Tax=Dictyobacter vulcani TaxID=2607529 RepID=UPI0013875E32|nr:DUF4231 domain-containing protein [Dictyobacter vulcani]